MFKEFLLTLVLFSAAASPFAGLFSKQNHHSNSTPNPTSNIQQSNLSFKNQAKPAEKIRNVASFRPVTPSNLGPSSKHKNVDPDGFKNFVDIKINPTQQKYTSYFKFNFYLGNKLITAKDNQLSKGLGKNGVSVTSLSEYDRGDLFLSPTDFSKLQIKLLIPGQAELQKRTHLKLDPVKMKQLKSYTLADMIQYQTIQFSIDVHGISVSPHVEFHINYNQTGTGIAVNTILGIFEIYNMDQATRNFWKSVPGVITISILVFVVLLTVTIIFTAWLAPFDFSQLTLSFLAAFKITKFVLTKIIWYSILETALAGGSAYLITSFVVARKTWYNWHFSSVDPQNKDPNKKNYHKYINWSDTKWVFLPGKTDKYKKWNDGFQKIFNNLLADHNPYNQQATNNNLNVNLNNQFQNDSYNQNIWNGENRIKQFV